MISGRDALIEGVAAQDGAYRSEHLLSNEYQVRRIKLRASSFYACGRVIEIFENPTQPTSNYGVLGLYFCINQL